MACPTKIVKIPNGMPNVPTAEFSEIAVTIPGNAIGRTRRNETVLRPKKWNRWTANAAALPRSNAIVVASRATWTELRIASRTAASRNAIANHFSV